MGDSARAPYGSRSPKEIYTFTVEAVDFLFAHGCDLIIIACNTASAEAVRKIQREYLPKKYPHKRVLGVIVPALEEAIVRTKTKRVGVIATEATVASNTFPREMKLRDPRVHIFQNGAPLLVPLVEMGQHRTLQTNSLLKKYLQPLLKSNIDTLILGCTHYGHLISPIRKITGKGIRLISEGPIVARKLRKYLTRHPEMESLLVRTGGVVFYSTDASERFRKFGSMFYGRPIRPLSAKL